MYLSMNLYHLNNLLRTLPEFTRLLAVLKEKHGSRAVAHLPEQAYGSLTASISEALNSPVLFLSAHAETARWRYEQIKLWLPDEQSISYFPEVDLLATSNAGDPLVISERLKILSQLSDCNMDQGGSLQSPVIVASSLSLISKSVSKKDFSSICFKMKRSDLIKPSELLEKLQSMGYEHDEIVEIPGTFSKRGGIVDIFPSGRDVPVRIEVFVCRACGVEFKG